MDLEPQNLSPREPRVTSSLGFEYEAQIAVIRQKHGNLEDIRHRLGLSRRKIAQLLMVDPSAWTRWTKTGGTAPPHIFRALEWYLLLQEKYPGMDSPFWLESIARPARATAESIQLKDSLLALRREAEAMRFQLRLMQFGLAVFVVITFVFLRWF